MVLKKVIVFGGSGLVGARFVELNSQKFEIIAPMHTQVDLLNERAVFDFLKASDATVVLNCVGFTDVDNAEDQIGNQDGDAYKLNALVPKYLAQSCVVTNKYLIHLSTDYVFEGTITYRGYKEEDKTYPLNWYGKTKLAGEQEILNLGTNHTIARIEMPYSAKYEKKSDFARFFYTELKKGNPIRAVDDQKITPIFTDDLVKALSVIIDNPVFGIIHLASKSSTTPRDFAVKLAECLKLDKELVREVKFASFNKDRKASRPQNSWMSVEKFEKIYGKGILRTVEEELADFCKQISS